MKLLSIFIFVIFAINIVGCKSRNILTEYEGVRYKIADGWVFNSNESIKVTYFQGVDSVPGSIIIENDSIELVFDASREMSIPDYDCNMSNDAERAKQLIASGHYKYIDRPDTLHYATVDTVNGKIATIIRPIIQGKGMIEIKILDCNSGAWISIDGKDIPYEKQDLVMAIYKSLRRE